ncbi:HNH endonuclease [Staphylococcus phage Alsa_3]|nr:HNH endonuclease [Staphylococcus phage Alsa_3]WNM51184.1 HNH endonuclease [Staphylococcus phage Alsa_4]
MVAYNNDWFLKRVKEKRPNDYFEYEFLEPYKNSKTKIKTKHNKCNKIIDIIPNTFLSRGSKCPNCARESATKLQTKSHKDFEKELPTGIIALTKYQGAYKPITVHCFFCDNTYTVNNAREITKGCSRCTKRYNRTLKDIKLEILKETKGQYKLVSKTYTNAHTPIDILHKECGHTYKVTIANFRKGRRCPHCKKSIGESLVEMFLVENDINFETQKKFTDLKLKSNLSYDFYLPDFNILIEYQGEQHYKPIKHFGGKKTFENQKMIDNIKKQYAIDNNFKLIEIPYTKRTYETISKYLSKLLS